MTRSWTVLVCSLCGIALLAGACGSSGGGSDLVLHKDAVVLGDVLDGADVADAGMIACPEGSTLVGSICQVPCPDGWERNGDGPCSPPCPEGHVAQGQMCVPPCPEGLEPDGPLCRPPGDSVGPLPCLGGAEFDATGAEEGDLVLYVHADKGSPDGPGTDETVPFATLEQALDSLSEAPDSLALILGPGTYDAFDVPKLEDQAGTIRVLGACWDSTIVQGDLFVGSSTLLVEFRRVRFTYGALVISESPAVSVEDCVFEGSTEKWAGNLLDWLASEEGPGELVVRRNLFLDGSTALSLGNGLAQGVVENNSFEEQTASTIYVSWVGQLTFANNMLLNESGAGEGSPAVTITAEAGMESELTITGNWIGGGRKAGIGLIGVGGKITVSDNSVAGCKMMHISGKFLGGGGEPREDPYPIVFSGNRVTGAEQYGGGSVGISVGDSEGVMVTGGFVSGVGDAGLSFTSSRRVMVSNIEATDCLGAGLAAKHMDLEEGLEVENVRLTGNDRGIHAHEGGHVKITGAELGANSRQGILLMEVTGADIRDSVIGSNGSTGIDLTSLRGKGDAVHTVSGNVVVDNKGLGIVVKAGGEGLVAMEDNEVRGTRPGSVSNAQYPSFEVGDGFAVLTGADGIASTVEFSGVNSVGANARLGILAFGEGTSMNVTEDVAFGDGNGYACILGDPPQGADWNLVQANGAEIVGAEATVATGDIPAPDSVMLGGGGEPR